MGLSVKVSLLVCLGFTGAICWLVNQVAKPIVQLRAAAIYAAPTPRGVVVLDRPAPAQTGGAPTAVAGQFAFASAVESAADRTWAAPKRELADTRPALAASEARSAPSQAQVADDSAWASSAASAADEDTAPHARRFAVPEFVLVSDVGAAEIGLTADGSNAEDVDAGSDAVAAPEPTIRTHTVRSGDTLASIARGAWNSSGPDEIRALLGANPQLKARPHLIRVGEALLIPGAPNGGAAAPVVDAPGPADTAIAASVRSGESSPPARTYTVRRNDSLVRIARRALKDPDRWRDIARLNDLKDANNIAVGRTLLLPEDS